VAHEYFLNKRGRGAENIKYKFRFAKIAKHLHQSVISMGVGLQSFNLNSPSAWRFGGIYYQNNPFLCMFQRNSA